MPTTRLKPVRNHKQINTDITALLKLMNSSFMAAPRCRDSIRAILMVAATRLPQIINAQIMGYTIIIHAPVITKIRFVRLHRRTLRRPIAPVDRGFWKSSWFAGWSVAICCCPCIWNSEPFARTDCPVSCTRYTTREYRETRQGRHGQSRHLRDLQGPVSCLPSLIAFSKPFLPTSIERSSVATAINFR
jgi:hypothetical protein